MADHYGEAERVIGAYKKKSVTPIIAFTKWCPPESGDKSFQQAEKAVSKAMARMGLSQIQLMQYHCWDYTDDMYLFNLSHLQKMKHEGKIAHIGLTNVDTAHLELLIHSGIEIATNQVSCSVLDMRLIRGRMASVCAEHEVGVLAYGTLLGGFLSEKWLHAEEPEDLASLNWSLRKYLRFIHAAGGWQPFQVLLQALSVVAKKHNVSIAAVATRWVLDIPVVSAVIVGCRLTDQSREYGMKNLAAFVFKLDDEDRMLISDAQARLQDIPGDCGDEYRRQPFLTAAGDLSHHIRKSDKVKDIDALLQKKQRLEYSSGSKWESIAGYCRAVRVGDRIYVSGTTATPPPGLIYQAGAIGGKSARSQTVAVLDMVFKAIKGLGGHPKDVVRTRIMLRNEDDVRQVKEAHGWAFKCEGIRPANTLILAGLIGAEFLVEIEAEAVLSGG
ncbi:Flagellar radial spoke protein 5 [Pseudocercospora fuligena]|uniref:Flagellar radial spoke protein 5 n=1 Tax=Pseudocercospora fuligena TaxID=685502 RepID=A0A8H6VN09_9PEZI|nr:Flagellar radial spoke protein 5 [Pseudocercospora fuligena]